MIQALSQRVCGAQVLDKFLSQREFCEDVSTQEEARTAPRFTLLIRIAKLICEQGEFICVVRDLSSTGISLRYFHPLPSCETYSLELLAGEHLEIRNIWDCGREGGFEFVEPVEVAPIIKEVSRFRKRGVRLGLQFPVTVSTLTQSHQAIVHNLSQQGARIEIRDPLAIDQTVRIRGRGLHDVRAKVRWRKNGEHGLVFEDTFSVGQFAELAARLQCPELLRV